MRAQTYQGCVQPGSASLDLRAPPVSARTADVAGHLSKTTRAIQPTLHTNGDKPIYVSKPLTSSKDSDSKQSCRACPDRLQGCGMPPGTGDISREPGGHGEVYA